MLSPIISARFLVFSAGAEADDFFGEPVAAWTCGFLGGSILVVWVAWELVDVALVDCDDAVSIGCDGTVSIDCLIMDGWIFGG